MTVASPLIEALDTGQPGRRWRIRVIRAGLSGNGNFYPDAVLREAAARFDGVRVFVKGDADHLAGKGKDFRNLIGRLTEPRFVEGQGKDGGEIQATLEMLDAGDAVSTKLREAWDRKMTGLFGFSIDARGQTETGRIGGRRARVATQISEISSVDLIVEPGAGGALINLIEAKKDHGRMDHLTEALVTDIVKASGLPEAAQQRIIDDHSEPEAVTEDELREAIKRERDYLAKFTESGKVRMADHGQRVHLIEGREDKTAKMLDAFFDPEDRSVTSIRQTYLDITGDRRFTGTVRGCDQSLMREALGTASFADVLGDSVARRMVKDYNKPNVFDAWRAIVNVVPVADFRTQERARFGGYGDLPIVAERDPYTELASPTDEKASYAIAKRGGTENISLEMITNDDVGAVRRVPDQLSRAAKRTISTFVFDLIKDNPVIYDTVNLFHADHGNLGSTALSGATVAAGRLAMRRQTEKDSGERIGIGPRYLLVPDTLEETAVDLFRRNTENDKTFVQSLALEVLPVWYWTDANNWYLAADPMDITSIEIGFLGGNEEPELFVQDSPTVGSLFSNDTVTYKLRHIYGGTITDFRGLFGAIVA